MSDVTVHMALKLGENVNEKSALAICKYLNVSPKSYFDIQAQDVQYSLSANSRIKSLMSSVLAKAVKRGLIERNYATEEFIDPVVGTTRQKEILSSTNEIQAFMRCIALEKDIRKKVAFSLYIYMGLRGAEVAGLEWKDINFMTNEISIRRNSIYVHGFGVITKKPKTKKSEATLSVPQGLIDLLAKYKTWWDIEKINHGDLWENTDRLFVQENGNNRSGQTLSHWLENFQKTNGLKKVSPHGLRHTNITMQISNGVDPKTVSERARHTDIQTTMNIYAHYVSEADRKAADTIDQILRIN